MVQSDLQNNIHTFNCYWMVQCWGEMYTVLYMITVLVCNSLYSTSVLGLNKLSITLRSTLQKKREKLVDAHVGLDLIIVEYLAPQP